MLFKPLTDGFRSLFFIFDKIAYFFIPQLYKLMMYLANVDLFTNNSIIQSMMSRIYILVGIFMLFRLSFSIVSYVVNPDAFSDESKGFTNIIKRVMIALILLATIPWLFGQLYDIQGKIISSGVIPNLILGGATTDSDGESSLSDEKLDSAAKDVQFLLFSPFFTLNTNGDTLKVCTPTTDYPLMNVIGTTDMALGTDSSGASCLEKMASTMDDNSDLNSAGVKLSQFFRTTKTDDTTTLDTDQRDFSKLENLVTWAVDDEYAFNYMPIISTLCGGYLTFLLISFCIDVASRAIKLLFLQVLSPIAVISSVDPTKGPERLKEWGKECFSTFASLFVRLAIMFIIIQTVKIITNTVYGTELYSSTSGLHKGNGTMDLFVYIFLVLGAFQVGKSLPGMLEKATGMKMGGDLNLNPFKNSLASRLAVGAGILAPAAAMGVAGNVAGNIIKNKKLKDSGISEEEYKKQRLGAGQIFSSAIAGGASSAVRSAYGAGKTLNPFKGLNMGLTGSSNARRSRQAGYGFVQNTKDYLQEVLGLEQAFGTSDKVKSKIKEDNFLIHNYERDETAAAQQMSLLKSSNPNKTGSYNHAFKKDDNGMETKAFNKYDDFLLDYAENGGNADFKAMYNEYNSITDPDEKSKHFGAMSDLMAQSGEVLSKQEFDSYSKALTARDEADAAAKKLQSEVNRLQEVQGFRKHYGPDKK